MADHTIVFYDDPPLRRMLRIPIRLLTSLSSGQIEDATVGDLVTVMSLFLQSVDGREFASSEEAADYLASLSLNGEEFAAMVNAFNEFNRRRSQQDAPFVRAGSSSSG